MRDKTCTKVPVLGIEPSTFEFCHFLVIFPPSELPCLGFRYMGFSDNKIIKSKPVFILHLAQLFLKTLVFRVLKKLFESRLVLQVFNQKWEQNVTRTQKSLNCRFFGALNSVPSFDTTIAVFCNSCKCFVAVLGLLLPL